MEVEDRLRLLTIVKLQEPNKKGKLSVEQSTCKISNYELIMYQLHILSNLYVNTWSSRLNLST